MDQSQLFLEMHGASYLHQTIRMFVDGKKLRPQMGHCKKLVGAITFLKGKKKTSSLRDRLLSARRLQGV